MISSFKCITLLFLISLTGCALTDAIVGEINNPDGDDMGQVADMTMSPDMVAPLVSCTSTMTCNTAGQTCVKQELDGVTNTTCIELLELETPLAFITSNDRRAHALFTPGDNTLDLVSFSGNSNFSHHTLTIQRGAVAQTSSYTLPPVMGDTRENIVITSLATTSQGYLLGLLEKRAGDTAGTTQTYRFENEANGAGTLATEYPLPEGGATRPQTFFKIPAGSLPSSARLDGTFATTGFMCRQDTQMCGTALLSRSVGSNGEGVLHVDDAFEQASSDATTALALGQSATNDPFAIYANGPTSLQAFGFASGDIKKRVFDFATLPLNSEEGCTDLGKTQLTTSQRMLKSAILLNSDTSSSPPDFNLLSMFGTQAKGQPTGLVLISVPGNVAAACVDYSNAYKSIQLMSAAITDSPQFNALIAGQSNNDRFEELILYKAGAPLQPSSDTINNTTRKLKLYASPDDPEPLELLNAFATQEPDEFIVMATSSDRATPDKQLYFYRVNIDGSILPL